MDFLNTAEKRDRRMVHLPMGRFGEAVEIAQAACFRASLFLPLLWYIAPSLTLRPFIVASNESSYITGTDFKVDGGLTSCYVTPLGEPALDVFQELVNLLTFRRSLFHNP